MGDQILDVNNQSFLDITHDEAVSILKYCKTPMMTIRPVGKVRTDWDGTNIAVRISR